MKNGVKKSNDLLRPNTNEQYCINKLDDSDSFKKFYDELRKDFNFSNKFNNEMKKIINDFEVYKRYR